MKLAYAFTYSAQH